MPRGKTASQDGMPGTQDMDDCAIDSSAVDSESELRRDLCSQRPPLPGAQRARTAGTMLGFIAGTPIDSFTPNDHSDRDGEYEEDPIEDVPEPTPMASTSGSQSSRRKASKQQASPSPERSTLFYCGDKENGALRVASSEGSIDASSRRWCHGQVRTLPSLAPHFMLCILNTPSSVRASSLRADG
jgi:hypothetical protein